MQIARIPHYLKKIIELGPRTSFIVAKNRLHAAWHESQVRRKASQGTASHTWEVIVRNHALPEDFLLFWQKKKKHTLAFLDSLYELPADQVRAQADCFEQKIFDLLGSGALQFSSMPWHSDFRLHVQDAQADHLFDKNMFYKDIHVQPGTDSFVKDIKVPWELSRCQHLFVLGKAYQYTTDTKYAYAFVEHVSDWIRENPYLLGANWVCPMDVGIRALNWICAFHFFKDASVISENFWQVLVSSLYDHLIYLENNWEIYDGRTSNHYLSDLIGYFYLCYFFRDLSGVEQKLAWCRQEIINECEKQVYLDGSDYEGSTKYHGLVTELFFHAHCIAQEIGMPFPREFEEKLQKMFEFVAWTKDVQIGDNDSGRVLYYGLPSSLIKTGAHEDSIKVFPYFGLSCAVSGLWHVSVRHHAYNKQQPSGHFHNDVGSITVTVGDMPLIVDPGSYVYTPSAYWRNYFRSVQQHNTFSLEGKEPVPLDNRLFALDIPEHDIQVHDGQLSMYHTLYDDITAYREVSCQGKDLCITDWWQGKAAKKYPTVWNFIVAPGIEVEKTESGIALKSDTKKIAEIKSDLVFDVHDTWVSEHYGSKVPCKRLQAHCEIRSGQKITTVMTMFYGSTRGEPSVGGGGYFLFHDRIRSR